MFIIIIYFKKKVIINLKLFKMNAYYFQITQIIININDSNGSCNSCGSHGHHLQQWRQLQRCMYQYLVGFFSIVIIIFIFFYLGNAERGWNDPPMFLHTPGVGSTNPSSSKRTSLNKRVAHPGLFGVPGTAKPLPSGNINNI